MIFDVDEKKVKKTLEETTEQPVREEKNEAVPPDAIIVPALESELKNEMMEAADEEENTGKPVLASPTAGKIPDGLVEATDAITWDLDEKESDLTVNPLLEELSDYLVSVRGYSPNTIRSYNNDLIHFFRFLLVREGQFSRKQPFETIPIAGVTVETLSKVKLPDIYAFLGYATSQRGNVDSTRKRKTSAIRALYHFLTVMRKEDMVDPTQNLEVPKVKRRDPIYLTLDEALSLLNAVDGPHAERDLAIITLFLNCGMRLSELTGLRLKDVQDETLHIVGKGNKERNIQLNDACVEALNNYLLIRPTKEDGVEDDHIFLSNRKKQISNRNVQTMVQKYIMKAGLDPEKVSVHKLRHTAATLMHKYGQVDIRTLQKVLGHENISTTEIYTHIEDDDVRDALYKNPLGHYHVPE